MHNVDSKINLSIITDLIIKIIHPEIIICFGKRTKQQTQFTCFREAVVEKTTATYDLLIIAGNTGTRSTHEWEHVIETRCIDFAPLTALVHTTAETMQAIEQGNPFFINAFSKGIMLYHSGKAKITVPHAWQRSEQDMEKQNSHWQRGYGSAGQFLEGAAFYSTANQYRHAAFMLHQCAEAACNSLIKLFTGYRTCTHNISRLLRLIENFTLRLTPIFPANTPEEKHLLALLVKAYSGARYQEAYTITKEELTILLQRVTNLYIIAGKLGQKKLAAQLLPFE
jgi:HEPN domain-containing protein